MDVGDRDFQLDVVRLMLHDASFFRVARDLVVPDSFADPVDKRSVSLLLDHIERYRSAPDLKVLCHLHAQDGAESEEVERIRQRYAKPARHPELVRDLLRDFAKLSAATALARRMVELARTGDYDAIRKEASRISSLGANETGDGSDWADTIAHRLRAYKSELEDDPRLTTGLSSLDDLIDGGLGVGEIGCLVSYPSGGKTTGLVNIGVGALMSGHTVFHATCEVSEKKTQRRYDMAITGMSKSELRSKQRTAYERMVEAARSMAGGSLYVHQFSANRTNVDDVARKVDEWSQNNGRKVDLVVVDYAELVNPSRSYNDRRHEIESVFTELRSVGAERSSRVWTAAQTNRSGLEADVIGMKEIGECFGIAKVSDVLVSINSTLNERKTGSSRLHLAKAREDGANSGTTWQVRFVANCGRIEDVQ